MRTNSPQVSIGMPVYNGERYLAETLDSLLGQTFTDFELIISDNASTDCTEEICTSYAAKDQRIRYYRNERNVGAIRNFNRTFELANGLFFMWASHDDTWAPSFLARCTEALDVHPETILAYTKTTIIDANGEPVSEYDPYFRTDSPMRHVRLHDLLRSPHKCFQLLGLIRTSILAQTPLFGSYTSSDIVLLAQLGLLGRFHKIPEPLVCYRHHPQQSIRLDRHGRMAWADPAHDSQLTLPTWRLFFELVGCLQRVPLSWGERMRCYFTLLQWPFWYRNWRRMGRDLLKVSLHLLAFSWWPAHRMNSRKDTDRAPAKNLV
jgi:hypothetical protein